jgi:hypothetical protein
MSSKGAEKKFNIKAAVVAIGISPSGVRLLLNQKKLGWYQSGTRLIDERSIKPSHRRSIEKEEMEFSISL